MSDKTKIIKRRQQVKDFYFIRRFNIDAVSTALGVDVKTIGRDIKEIREEFANSITVIDVQRVLQQVMQTREKVLQKLWAEYDRKVDQSDGKFNYRYKIAALTAIDTIESKTINDLQELGYIPKPTDRLEIGQKQEDLLEKVNLIIKDGHKFISKEGKPVQVDSELRALRETTKVPQITKKV